MSLLFDFFQNNLTFLKICDTILCKLILFKGKEPELNIYDIIEDLNEIREKADNRRKNTVYLTSLILLIFIDLPFLLYVFALLIWIFALYQMSSINSFFYRIFFRDEKDVLQKISSYELTKEQENALMKFYFPYLDGDYKTLEKEFGVTINVFEATYGHGSKIYRFASTFQEHFGADNLSAEEAKLLGKICISVIFADKLKLIKKYKVPLNMKKYLVQIFEEPVEPVPKNLNKEYEKIIE